MAASAARTTADVAVRTYHLTTEAAELTRQLWNLSAQDWSNLLEGKTDALEGKLPDALLIALDVGHDAMVDLIAKLDDQDIASASGRLVGIVTYEVLEGLALAAATAGAGAAVKGLKVPRLILTLKKFPGLKHSDAVAKAVDKIAFRVGNILGTRMCFVAGTEVHTERGLKNIEDILPGDLVLSRPETAERIAPTCFRPVVQTFRTRPDTIYHLTIRTVTGATERLSTTAPHPFFVVGKRQFIAAKDLSVGNELSLPEGTAVVVAIATERAPEGQSFTTYNFEVAEHHTYFAGELGVWVHNTGDLLCERLAAKFERLANEIGADKAFRAIEDDLDGLFKSGRLSANEYETHWRDAFDEARERVKSGVHIVTRKLMKWASSSAESSPRRSSA